MLLVSRGALLATTATIAAGLLAGPGVAYAADSSTPLTAAEMAAELKAVNAASAQAAAGGWRATVKIGGGSMEGAEFFAVDPVGGVAFERFDFDGDTSSEYVAQGKGRYSSLDDPASRAAVKMMGRPAVRFVFTADKSVKLDEEVSGSSPATMLTDVDQAGTKTVHDDGSADYRVTEDKATMTAHVTAAGMLASVAVAEGGSHATFTYSYGPQHVTLPAGSVTIGNAALNVGLAYLDMAKFVKAAAGAAATDALQEARGHRITVSALRDVTRGAVQEYNGYTGVNVVRTKNVRGGVRVYATNPWTHKTAAYTLQPSGRKVTIAKN